MELIHKAVDAVRGAVSTLVNPTPGVCQYCGDAVVDGSSECRDCFWDNQL